VNATELFGWNEWDETRRETDPDELGFGAPKASFFNALYKSFVARIAPPAK
jgi:hypothetical protein